MIKSAESALIQPIDRDYKRKGIVRQTHLEVKSDGTSYALRAGGTDNGFNQKRGWWE